MCAFGTAHIALCKSAQSGAEGRCSEKKHKYDKIKSRSSRRCLVMALITYLVPCGCTLLIRCGTAYAQLAQ